MGMSSRRLALWGLCEVDMVQCMDVTRGGDERQWRITGMDHDDRLELNDSMNAFIRLSYVRKVVTRNAHAY